MHISPILQLMLLLTMANGAPVAAKKIFGSRFAAPLDFSVTFVDGRPVFGSSKTIRGIVTEILAAKDCAPLIGLDLTIAAIVACTSMAGDLFSSFVKRRLKLPPSSQALGLDQIPESLLPLLPCRDDLSLTVA